MIQTVRLQLHNGEDPAEIGRLIARDAAKIDRSAIVRVVGPDSIDVTADSSLFEHLFEKTSN
jgi:hypothetical protein